MVVMAGEPGKAVTAKPMLRLMLRMPVIIDRVRWLLLPGKQKIQPASAAVTTSRDFSASSFHLVSGITRYYFRTMAAIISAFRNWLTLAAGLISRPDRSCLHWRVACRSSFR